MLPLGDDNSYRKTTPVITFLLSAVNLIVFFLELIGGDAFIEKWAFIPSQFFANPLPNVITIFTSMFMHAGWLHLLGNMLYLWIFGDNVEDRLGHLAYLNFYLAGGFIAAAAHVLFNPHSTVPTVGASGAIGAVLGAYLVFYPRARIYTFIPIGFWARLRLVPAVVVLGLWFVLQLFSGFASLDAKADVGGTAFWAHIGGFLFGLLIGFLFKPNKSESDPRRF